MKPGLKTGPIRVCTAIAVIALAGGCVSKDMSDLEQYKDQVLARKGRQHRAAAAHQARDLRLSGARARPARSLQVLHGGDPEKVQADKGMDETQQKFVDEIQTHNREELETF
ncbi:MAG: hypothetical protein V9G12_24195 [Microthrixaceae bacterium]